MRVRMGAYGCILVHTGLVCEHEQRAADGRPGTGAESDATPAAAGDVVSSSYASV
jgi:hypothetical protein